MFKKLTNFLTGLVFGIILFMIMVVAAYGLVAIAFMSAVVLVPFLSLGRVCEIFNK